MAEYNQIQIPTQQIKAYVLYRKDIVLWSAADWWDRFLFPSGSSIILWEFGFELRLVKSHRFAHRSLTKMTMPESEIERHTETERER